MIVDAPLLLSTAALLLSALALRRSIGWRPRLAFTQEEGGFAPRRSTAASAGWDLRAPREVTLEPLDTVVIDVAVRVALPPGHVGLVVGRSGLGARGVVNPLGVGVVDEDYAETLRVALRNETPEPVKVGAGERVAQLVVLHLPDLRTLGGDLVRARRTGGFGSTGR